MNQNNTNNPTWLNRRTFLLATFALFALSAIGYFAFYKDTSVGRATWWNDNWSYRKQIVINHDYVAGDLENFPVLISFTDTSVASHTQSTGGDIVFISSEGKKLAHEIESFATSSTGAFVGWVKIPNLSSIEDTVINMYYGNPSASSGQVPEEVWDDNYIDVWHMADSALASSSDSTRNNHHGALIGNASTTASGILGPSLELDGSGDYVYLQDHSDFSLDLYNSAQDYTWEFWATPEAFTQWSSLWGQFEGTDDYFLIYAHTELSQTPLDSYRIYCGRG